MVSPVQDDDMTEDGGKGRFSGGTGQLRFGKTTAHTGTPLRARDFLLQGTSDGQG